MAYGFAYVDGARFDTGLFAEKRTMLCITTGGTPQRFSEGDAYGPIGQILKPIEHLSLRYMGIKVHEPFVALAAPRVDEAARISYPAAWREHLQALLDAA